MIENDIRALNSVAQALDLSAKTLELGKQISEYEIVRIPDDSKIEVTMIKIMPIQNIEMEIKCLRS